MTIAELIEALTKPSPASPASSVLVKVCSPESNYVHICAVKVEKLGDEYCAVIEIINCPSLCTGYVADERERCAKIAETFNLPNNYSPLSRDEKRVCDIIAYLIRA